MFAEIEPSRYSFRSPQTFACAILACMLGPRQKIQRPSLLLHLTLVRVLMITGWDPQLTRRIKALLHASPLLALKHNDDRRDQVLRHYDLLALAFRVFDAIVENTGFEHEIDRRGLKDVLGPLLTAMDEKDGSPPDLDRHGIVVERLLGTLLNDEQNRRPFESTYVDLGGSAAVTRILETRLLREHFLADGRVVLRLTNEALNLYLNALDLEVEDAQAAAEAVVQSQLARGRFDEAVQSANRARLHSLQLVDKIERHLGETRRNLSDVDWWAQLPELLDGALIHVRTRLSVEESIQLSAQEKLAYLELGTPEAEKVAQVDELMTDCFRRHIGLQQTLMGARQVFLGEQQRQSFTAAPPVFRPNLKTDVLHALLRAPRTAAATAVESMSPAFWGAAAPPVLNLSALINWHLRPRQKVTNQDVVLETPDLVQIEEDVVRYSAEILARVFGYLRPERGQVPLSTLLAEATGDDQPSEVLEGLVLGVLRQFAPDPHDDEPAWTVQPAGTSVDVAGFQGDDVLVCFEDQA